MSYSVVIVEDEPPARAKLERFIAELEDFRLAGHADSVDTAVAEIGYLSPDVVYLDVQLGARSGFEVVEGLKGITTPLIVFTTAYSEYAVKAFEIQALDYLLKPYDRERFLQSVGRVRAVLADPDRSDFEERVRRLLAGIPGRPPPAKQILVRTGERAFFLEVSDIQRVSAAGNYVEVHAEGQSHLIRESLTDFVAQLDPGEFASAAPRPRPHTAPGFAGGLPRHPGAGPGSKAGCAAACRAPPPVRVRETRSAAAATC